MDHVVAGPQCNMGSVFLPPGDTDGHSKGDRTENMYFDNEKFPRVTRSGEETTHFLVLIKDVHAVQESSSSSLQSLLVDAE